MMTSLANNRSLGTRDKVVPATSQSTQTQKQIQATAEQIRLAQVIYDRNDADFEGKVKQLMEVTGKHQDECLVALHDCNEDINRAINFLLEGSPDVSSWETVGRRRTSGKSSPSLENKENREKRSDREALRGRGVANRKGRGASRNLRSEENGIEQAHEVRGLDRDDRGRGRGKVSGGRGTSTISYGGRFSSQGVGTFNSSDLITKSGTTRLYSDTCQTGANDTNATGPWRSTVDEWAVEDWNEDLSETKVFTASAVPETGSAATAGQSVDLGCLLQKPSSDTEQEGTDAHSAQLLGYSLVFTNSHHHSVNGGPVLSYAHAALSSVLGSDFKDLRPSAVVQDVVQGKDLGHIPSQQPNDSIDNSAITGSVVSSSSVSLETTCVGSQSMTSVSSHFTRGLETQTEPSLVASHLCHQQQNVVSQAPSLPLKRPPSPTVHPDPAPLEESFRPQGSPEEPPDSARVSLLPPTVPEPQVSSIQQRQTKAQKRRIHPISKIPSLAVEMPGSADITGLNLQFGALDFASEPVLKDSSQTDNCPSKVPETTAAVQAENLHAKLTGLSADSRLEGAVPSHPCLALPQSRETSPLFVMDGCHGIRTAIADTTSTTVTLKPDFPTTPSSTPSVSLASSSTAVPLQTPELSAALSSGESSGPSSSSVSSSSSLASTGLDSTSCVSSPSASVLPAAATGVAGDGAVGVTSSLHMAGVLTPSGNGTMAASVCPMAPPQSSSSNKAPPNLSQGVPPLLPSQYIVGPSGLLPAYPQMYGYEDLHMLQSRPPADYYGMTFPNSTAALPGRELNGPYSGDVTKFVRRDSVSPAPSTSLSAPLPPQTAPPPVQAQNQSQAQQPHSSQQAFLNSALPPGYSYPGLPYYPGIPGVPGTFQYGPTVFVPPNSAKHQGVGLGGTSGHVQQQSYSSSYDDPTQGPAVTGEYSKGFSNLSQTQSRSAAAGPSKGVSVTSSSGPLDNSTSIYKTQAFDKQGFHTGTSPPFSLPSALGSPLNPGAGPGYGPASFLHILPPHQQTHNQLVHHQLMQDGQGTSSQRSQSTMPQKPQAHKPTYGSSPYWGN